MIHPSFRSLASTVREFVEQGSRKLVITSAAPGEGKSTITAQLGKALVRSSGQSVILVDTDPFRPRLHDVLGIPNGKGLGDLLQDVYRMELTGDATKGFGLGDWVELLRAQAKTGRLRISQGTEEFVLAFERGRITSLSGRERAEERLLGNLLLQQGRITADQQVAALRVQKEGQRRLGDVIHALGYAERGDVDAALQLQLRETLHKIVTLSQPRYDFQDSVRGPLPSLSGRTHQRVDSNGINGVITGRLLDHLKQPYLSSRIPSYLSETGAEGLKALTHGTVSYDLGDTAFDLLIDRLATSYDAVLMDCPPVALTSPTGILARLADGVILVVQAEGYDVRIVQQAKDQLLKSGARVLGVVLNRVDLKQDKTLSYYYGAYPS